MTLLTQDDPAEARPATEDITGFLSDRSTMLSDDIRAMKELLIAVKSGRIPRRQHNSTTALSSTAPLIVSPVGKPQWEGVPLLDQHVPSIVYPFFYCFEEAVKKTIPKEQWVGKLYQCPRIDESSKYGITSIRAELNIDGTRHVTYDMLSKAILERLGWPRAVQQAQVRMGTLTAATK